MHSKLIRYVTVFIMLICLPLQGMAAVAMPACQAHGEKLAMHTIVNESDTQFDAVHHQVESSSNCDQHTTDNQQAKSSTCDKCFFCYLSATQGVIPLIISINVIGAATTTAAPLAASSSAFAIPPYHPPRSISAWC